MTPNQFRRLALSLPEAVESEHMGHPDFRVQGKIFASLGVPDKNCGMVKLTPNEQSKYCESDPDVFIPAQGAWGKQGCTYVQLKSADNDDVWNALLVAWRRTAPKKLSEGFE